MRAVYLRAVKSFNITTGAFNSQSFMERKFHSANINSNIVYLIPILQWILKAFTLSLNFKNSPILIAADHNNSFYSQLIMHINYCVFKFWLNRYVPNTILIMDGLFPLSKLPNNRIYINFIRSSPHCLVFSKQDNRRDHFLKKQLVPSNAIVCASPDAYDSWKSFGGLSSKEVFHIPVPLAKLLSEQDHELDNLDSIDNFINRNTNRLRLIISGGNLGPRKGIIPLFDQLVKLDSSRFEVHLFGTYNDEIKLLITKYPFNVFLHGYQRLDFLKCSSNNTLRVYPALSECMSAIHLQGMFSGDSCIIYQRGIEPCINEWMGNTKVVSSFADVVPYIEESNYNFNTNEVVEPYILLYKSKFNSEFDRLIDYVAEI